MDNTTNVWKQFQGILPETKRYSAEVISINGSVDTSVVEKRSGDRTVVKGSNITVGSRAWIVDGVVSGKASSLPYSEVTE